MSFLTTDMTQRVKISPNERQEHDILYQYRGCWWPGDVRSKGISSHVLGLFLYVYYSLSTRSVELLFFIFNVFASAFSVEEGTPRHQINRMRAGLSSDDHLSLRPSEFGQNPTLNITTVYLTVYSRTDQRIHQSFASLAFVRGIHRWPDFTLRNIIEMSTRAHNLTWRLSASIIPRRKKTAI